MSGQRASEGHARIAAERITKTILNFLLREGTATTVRLHKEVEGRRRTKIKALRSLLDAGQVLRIGSGKKCDPFRYRLGSHARVEVESAKPEIFEEVI